MTLPEQILAAMKRLNVTSQNTITAMMLWADEDIGRIGDEVEAELEKMYHSFPSLVNRAEITKLGKKYMGYWPTGIVQTTCYMDNVNKKPPTLVMRSELKQPTQIIQETNEMTPAINETDPTELKLLSYIKANPQCTLSRAERETKTSINTACSYLKWYFEQEYLTKEKYQNTNLIQFADKVEEMTAKQLYELHQKEKQAPGRKPKPAIIKAKTVAAAETNPAALEKKDPATTDEFKIAYTSNGTLIFYGIQDSPIELSVKQTHLLADFMNQSVNIE